MSASAARLNLVGTAVTRKGAVKATTVASVGKRIVDYRLMVCVCKMCVDEFEGLLMGKVEN